MMTIKEMSRLTGVSTRALRYYDEIGLFHPTGKSEAGYRLYDEDALAILKQILYFREIGVPLNTIKQIMNNPALGRDHILEAQKKMLIAEKERLERIINSIDDALKGAGNMDFTVFNREESAELFNTLFENMSAAVRDAAIKEFGSAEEWKDHYLDAVSSEKVSKQFAKIVKWYGAKGANSDDEEHPLSKEVRSSYKRRIEHILDKLAGKKGMDVNSFEVRKLIGEYGFVMKQLLQLKNEKEIMLAQAQSYLDDATRASIDGQYGEGFADFLNHAITAFYNRA